jgi:hypothetical protein
MKIKLICRLSFLIISFFLFNASTYAQMSNTDTVERGMFYVEANVGSGVQNHRNGGQQVYGGRFSYGLKHNLEIGVNSSVSNPLDAEYPIEIQPNIKWKVYRNEAKGIEASAGAIAFIPFAKRTGANTFVMTYTNLSKKAKYGTRFTVGAYALLNHKKEFGTNNGVNLMIEKNVTKKANLSVQWMSGKNRFGYLTGGVNYQVGKKNSLYLGYCVGNYDYDNHGPLISFSRYF